MLFFCWFDCTYPFFHSDPLATILVRACKTMCHEMGHMFGLRHCTHFHCLMNGSNHLAESDSRPSFLCPICLRKLQHVCKFDIIQRYKDMKDFWAEQGLRTHTDWLERRLSKLLAWNNQAHMSGSCLGFPKKKWLWSYWPKKERFSGYLY